MINRGNSLRRPTSDFVEPAKPNAWMYLGPLIEQLGSIAANVIQADARDKAAIADREDSQAHQKEMQASRIAASKLDKEQRLVMDAFKRNEENWQDQQAALAENLDLSQEQKASLYDQQKAAYLQSKIGLTKRLSDWGLMSSPNAAPEFGDRSAAVKWFKQEGANTQEANYLADQWQKQQPAPNPVAAPAAPKAEPLQGRPGEDNPDINRFLGGDSVAKTNSKPTGQMARASMKPAVLNQERGANSFLGPTSKVEQQNQQTAQVKHLLQKQESGQTLTPQELAILNSAGHGRQVGMQ